MSDPQVRTRGRGAYVEVRHTTNPEPDEPTILASPLWRRRACHLLLHQFACGRERPSNHGLPI